MNWVWAAWAICLVVGGLGLIVDLRRAYLGRGDVCLTRILLCILPLALTLWVYGSAAVCVHRMREAGDAICDRDLLRFESHFVEKVMVGVKEYARGPELLAVYSGNPRIPESERMTKADVQKMQFRPCFDPSDPGHFYVQPIVEHAMPGLTLFRFRLTGRGWRIDREMGWGCLQSEADSAFLSRLKAIPFW